MARRRALVERPIALIPLIALLLVATGCAAEESVPSEPVAAFAAVATATPTLTPTPTPTPTVVVTKEIVTETAAVAHGSSTSDDDTMDQGTIAVVVAGADGILTRTIEVTKQDGVETARATISEVITTVPIDEVIHNGTRAPAPAPAPPAGGGCDPNYTGACVPIASDVDCAGGSGNGPAYVSGPVTVVGNDIYDLDRDGDGIACD